MSLASAKLATISGGSLDGKRILLNVAFSNPITTVNDSDSICLPDFDKATTTTF